ncbi:MAG: hypothetical protein AB7T59_06820 [Hyphomonadaceae bacterium]
MTAKHITIAPRFNGPPGSGNGGYVCGLMARELDGASEATLRAPPPLGVPLRLTGEVDGSVHLYDGHTLLGEAHPTALDLAPLPAPSLDEARAAAKRYAGLQAHRYSTCFTCGPSRPPHDGLHLYTGAVEGRDMVACTWTPTRDLDRGDGRVAPEFVHAALDCPSYWSLPGAGMAALLARLAASIDADDLPRIGEELIVAAWPIASDGRKHRAATAIYTAGGAVIARAEALWIEPRGLNP